jgi:hypothetical protein
MATTNNKITVVPKAIRKATWYSEDRSITP